MNSVTEFFIIRERFAVITRQLQAAEVLSKLPTMNDKSSFFKVPLVITKQLVITMQIKLYFNNSSRIPTPESGLPQHTFTTVNFSLAFLKIKKMPVRPLLFT
jgi:hypothetical protein